jgi:hypothetical protein
MGQEALALALEPVIVGVQVVDRSIAGLLGEPKRLAADGGVDG